MTMDNQTRTLLTIREVQAKLGVSESTVRRNIRNGDLPAVRLGPGRGSAIRVDVHELDEYVYGEPEDDA